MALEAPLRSSTGSMMASFSPHTELSISSPESNGNFDSQYRLYVLTLTLCSCYLFARALMSSVPDS